MSTKSSVATAFFPTTSSTGHLAPPPSWADVDTSRQQEQQYNDVFSGMKAFDPNEKPAQVYQSHQNVQHIPLDSYFANGFESFAAAKQHHIGSLGEKCSYSSSSDDLSGSSSPTEFYGTTYWPSSNHQQCQSKKRSKHYSKLRRYAEVAKFKASKEELKKHAYPRFHDKWTKTASIADTQYTIGKNMWRSPSDKFRRCTRCRTTFEMAKNGKMGQMGCMYHSKGIVYNAERQENVRQCCGESDGLTEGCQLRRFHVYDQLLSTELETFVETERAWGIEDERSYNILAIDCEMVYTVAGPALARLSVVDWDGQLVMDILVKPPTMVIDPNTEYSGLTIEDIHGAQDTLQTCRQKFMTLVNAKTILVGHSLESDLKALRLVHSTVVDTSLLYLSKGYKVGLKKLALQHLGIHIQSNNEAAIGHDSTEDAQVSLELLKCKMAMSQ